MFHKKSKRFSFARKEDNEPGPYAPLQRQLRQIMEDEGGAAGGVDQGEPTALPANISPPTYTSAVPMTPMHTRSQGLMGQWSKTMGGLFDSRSPASPGPDIFPLIELPNPQAGQGLQPDTIRVYRTWTLEDVKKSSGGNN